MASWFVIPYIINFYDWSTICIAGTEGIVELNRKTESQAVQPFQEVL